MNLKTKIAASIMASLIAFSTVGTAVSAVSMASNVAHAETVTVDGKSYELNKWVESEGYYSYYFKDLNGNIFENRVLEKFSWNKVPDWLEDNLLTYYNTFGITAIMFSVKIDNKEIVLPQKVGDSKLGWFTYGYTVDNIVERVSLSESQKRFRYYITELYRRCIR